jgi:hypothetical protein
MMPMQMSNVMFEDQVSRHLDVRTSSGAEFRIKWSQSKPSTISEARDAVTGTSFKHIEMRPVSHGSVSSPESWDARVRSPELITQSRETDDLAARTSNIVDTATLQNVLKEDIREKSKSRCALAKFDVAIDLGD